MSRSETTVLALAVLLGSFAAGSCDGSGDDGTRADASDVADAGDAVSPDDGSTDDAGEDAAEIADAVSDDSPSDADGGDAPVSTTPPECAGGSGSGTRRSWEHPVTGQVYCEDVNCRGCTAVCRGDATADEGWYADCGGGTVDAGCGGIPNLIVRANCM